MISKRILIPAIHYYPDQPSGSSRLAFDEASFLVSLGHDVWLIAPDVCGDKPEFAIEDGVHILRFPIPKLGGFDPRRIWAHQSQTQNLLSKYVGDAIYLIHGHSLLHYAGAISLYGKSTKTYYSVHSPVRLEMAATSRGASFPTRLRLLVTAHLAHRIEHRVLTLSDCVTVDSEYTKSLLGRFHGIEIQQRTRVIPGWVDLNRFQVVPNRLALKSQLGWPTDTPVLFTLRRLVPRMGLDRLILAAKIVKSTGAKFFLVIGGAGPLRARLESLIKDLDLGKQVYMAGFIPENMLPSMYAAADAFVLPTAELECFGLIALEALACGRPVLATPVGAIPEILEHFEEQWLAQDASVEAISKLLTEYLRGDLPPHDPLLLREIASNRYSHTRILQQMIDTLGFVNSNEPSST